MTTQNNKVPKLRDRIIAILQKEGKPLDFQSIYKLLENDGHTMPENKPKLIVRKILFDQSKFTATKGLYEPVSGLNDAPVTTPAPSSLNSSIKKSVPSSTVAPKKPAPTPKPTQEPVKAKTQEPKSEPKATPTQKPAATGKAPKMKDRIIAILQKEGKPLDFNAIYKLIENDGHPMPQNKPKLIVRKILFDQSKFTATKGLYEPVSGLNDAPVTTPAPSSLNSSIKKSVPSSTVAPKKPAPTPKPTQEPVKAKAPEPKTEQKATPTQKPAATDKAPKMKDRIIAILQKGGKPLDFNAIYKLLENDGHHMPENKPKLIVRKALYNEAHFQATKKGLFSVVPGVKAESVITDPISKDKETSINASPQTTTQESEYEHKDTESISIQDAAKKAAEEATKLAVEQARRIVAEETSKHEQARILAEQAARKAKEEAAAHKAELERVRQEAFEEARKVAADAAKAAATEATLIAAREAAKLAEEQRLKLEAAEAARLKAIEDAKKVAEEAKRVASEAAVAAAAEAAKSAAEQASFKAERDKAIAIQQARDEAMATVRQVTQEAMAKEQSKQMDPLRQSASITGPVEPKKASLRERVSNIILEAGEPLSAGDIFEDLKSDGLPLPEENPKEVLKRILHNARIFEEVEKGYFYPLDF